MKLSDAQREAVANELISLYGHTLDPWDTDDELEADVDRIVKEIEGAEDD